MLKAKHIRIFLSDFISLSCSLRLKEFRFEKKMAFGFFLELLSVLILIIVGYFIYFKVVIANYWNTRNVPHAKPVFLLGNLWKSSIVDSVGNVLNSYYRQHKKEKMVGIWNFSTPFLILTDLELIKKVLIKDFDHFHDHGLFPETEWEPLAGHLFNLKGSKWRKLRVKLTPTFTSGKMKMMFAIMVQCGEQLQDYLKSAAVKEDEVEVKDILARFTTDIITSCAFGIESNSLKNPNSEFRKYGKQIFEPTFMQFLKALILNLMPSVFRLLQIRLLPKNLTNFFLNTVKDTMEYREKNNVKRNDFMQLLIHLKNKGKLDEVDFNASEAFKEEFDSVDDSKFTLKEAAAQVFVFFFAGFETSATLLSFALYELALNTDVQSSLQKEIDQVLKKHDKKITDEGIMEMEYLDWVIQETLRKYPPLSMLSRQCTKNYEIPELGVLIEKDTKIFIPVKGIQWDPEYFPNPAKFDPTRFSPGEKSKRDHLTSLYFGEGPRICIGMRFALLQSKIGLVSIVSHYNVEMSTNTPIPLKYDVRRFITSPQGGMPLKFANRN